MLLGVAAPPSGVVEPEREAVRAGSPVRDERDAVARVDDVVEPIDGVVAEHTFDELRRELEVVGDLLGGCSQLGYFDLEGGRLVALAHS